jgi:hypothetical protein
MRPAKEHFDFLQLRVRLLVVAFYILGIALLWYVRVHDCRSYMYTWYGLLPLQVSQVCSRITLPYTHSCACVKEETHHKNN